MWAMKVAAAAIGSLWTCGLPPVSKTPSPTPSGSLRLCAARLSTASNSQNAARTRAGAADSPNSRHTIRTPLLQGRHEVGDLQQCLLGGRRQPVTEAECCPGDGDE